MKASAAYCSIWLTPGREKTWYDDIKTVHIGSNHAPKTGFYFTTVRGRAHPPPLTSCALLPKSQHQHTTIPSQPKTVDAKAQQYYYDLGLQHYSEENYGEAKKAFHRVIENGPKTALGMKAHENIKKIERILKTLAEIESK
jgi:hypothetical protein